MTTVAAPGSEDVGRFPGGRVVAGCFIVLTTSSGLSFYGLAVYLNAFSKERGWSLASISLATTLFFVVGGFVGLVIARIIARRDVRVALVGGGVLGGLALAALGQVEERWQLYAVYAVFAVGFSAAGLIPVTTVVTRWYHARRSVALSVASTGLSVGGILITPFAGATPMKPGSATRPLPGIKPLLVDAEGKELEGAASGNLCVAASWPGQMRTVWSDHERFFATYFTSYKGRYFTGDGCRRDEDGYYWITGRVDDVINVSGHRIGTAEVESALVGHALVAEAAVVGFPHEIKGQAIYAYVTLNAGEEGGDELRKELNQRVRNDIGSLATLETIQFTPALPKTRSGKIMRRILRKIAEGETQGFGDTSTLADPAVVEALVKGRA